MKIYYFLILLFLIPKAYSQEIEYERLSSVEIVLKKNQLDGRYVEVMGYLSSVRWGGFYLYMDDVKSKYGDVASAIPFVTNTKDGFDYISAHCVDRFVKVKGKIKKEKKEKSYYEYMLVVDGIFGYSFDPEKGCHFNFLPPEKAKQFGFKQ